MRFKLIRARFVEFQKINKIFLNYTDASLTFVGFVWSRGRSTVALRVVIFSAIAMKSRQK